MRFLTPFVLAATLVVAQSLPAQVVTGRGGRMAVTTDTRIGGDRAVLGIQTSSGGARDTLGLLVAGVTAGGPADSAGIEEGHRIVAINGVNLRLASADAGDPDMTGVLGRRLQRELDKASPGDVVELRVWADGQTRTVRVKTVRADQLQAGRTLVRPRVDDRPTIGASVGGSPSARDTIGVFVVAVAEDGPLAKAGIFEGARISSINGVDLRVPAADAGDDFMSGARVRRFQREVERLTPGSSVELRVVANGQTRTVSVRPVRRTELKDSHSFTILRPGGGTSIVFPSFDFDGFRYDLQHEIPAAIRRSMEDASGELHRALDRIRDVRIHQSFRDTTAARIRERVEQQLRDIRPPVETRSRIYEPETTVDARRAAPVTGAVKPSAAQSSFNFTPAVMTSVAEPATASRVFSVAGVRLGPVDEQLASYLGAGSERGFLVLEVGSHWSGIRAGDVLLSIDGRSVRDGGLTSFAPSTAREYRVELLRNGKRMTEVVRQH